MKTDGTDTVGYTAAIIDEDFRTRTNNFSGGAYGRLPVLAMNASSGEVKLQGGSKLLCTVSG